MDDLNVVGVNVVRDGQPAQLYAAAVVLACGGFEACPRMRAQYLGPGWDLAYVRGTRYNTGDGFQMMEAIGAKLIGNWSGCHSVSGSLVSLRSSCIFSKRGVDCLGCKCTQKLR